MEQTPLFKRVIKAYTTPGHPIAFSAPGAVARHFKITHAKAKQILEHEEVYTVHREFKQPKIYNPHYVHRRREQIQADLIEIGDFAGVNNGVKYLLLLIDVFTKKIWMYPMKRKTGTESAAVIRRWLESLARTPEILRTDQGNEFAAQVVQTVLRSFRVIWQIAFGTSKASVAERANKTMQIIIYKFMHHNETFEYLAQLENLVKTYNTRPHHSLKMMTPNEADLVENQARVHAIHTERWDKLKKKGRGVKPKFNIHDVVRVKIQPKKIDKDRRAYAKQFKGEYFTVRKMNTTMAVPMYYLTSMDTGEKIKGGFYAAEIQKIRGNTYKVEDVVGERGRGAQKQLLVKWLYFGDRHNTWIKERDVLRVFRRR